MRSLDRYVAEKLTIPEELLMENAGQASYFVILDEFGIKDKKFVILCGIGNNGGDGFVVARKIRSSGGDVKVFILGDVSRYKGAAKKNFDILSGFPIEIRHIESIESIKSDVLNCDAFVDAIFGTGLTRNVEGLYRDVVQLINESGKKVFSIDIPSGINGEIYFRVPPPIGFPQPVHGRITPVFGGLNALVLIQQFWQQDPQVL